MRVECIQNCDADLGGGNRKALFVGQVYDLPTDIAVALIDDGLLRPLVVEKAVEPVLDKAEEPAEDKSVESPRRARRAK